MNLHNKKNLLLFSLAAETFFASYGLLLGSQTAVVSLLYVAAGGVFIFSILRLPPARLPPLPVLKNEYLLKSAVLVLMFLLAWITTRYWLDKIPLDPDFADMLPVMKVMNERALQGNWNHVYDPIPEIWNGTRPIYLPAMWLPYLPAVAIQADLRWVSVVAVFIGFMVILAMIRIRKNGYFGFALIALSILLFWWIFARNEVHSLITMSEEGVVIFYFVWLCVAIISGNAFFMGFTASLCVLSRYSMIGWLIPCLFYFIIRKDFRRFFIFSVTGAGCFLFFFLIPFGYKALEQMIALPGHYVAFSKQVWENTPDVYWLNLGLAKFYGPQHMGILHNTLVATSFGFPVLFMCYCLLKKKYSFNNINLACFKLSLLVFYQFIDVPYGYLFYTCSFVSLVIAANLLTCKMENVQEVYEQTGERS